MGAKLRKPKAIGHALVREHDSNIYDQKHIIPDHGNHPLSYTTDCNLRGVRGETGDFLWSAALLLGGLLEIILR